MGLLFKGLLLASLLVVQVICQTPITVGDPCIFPQDKQVFDVEDILSCYFNIPADATRIESTLASLHQLIQTYSFTDIAMANIPPYNVDVDLAAEMDNIAQKNWTHDYSFHMALSRLFNKLNDAHTMYYAPSPYMQCFGVKAFALVPANSATVKEDAPINLISNPLAFKSRPWNWPIDPSQYSGLQVMQINGQEPRDYLMDYSYHVGTFKDKIVRFNHLFDLVGWSVIDPYTFPISDIPNEVVTVFTADGKYVNVTVPVKMFCRELSFIDTKDFILQIDTPAGLIPTRSVIKSDATPDLRKERLRRIRDAIEPRHKPQVDSEMEKLSVVERFELVMNRIANKRAGDSAGSLQLVKSVSDNSMHLFVYVEGDNVVPVLKVVSFAPESDDDQNAWVQLALGFNAIMYKYNFSYAIVDVNKNGGGTICFSLLLQSLMDERIASVDVNHANVLWTPYNMRKTAMFDTIYNEGIQEMDDDYLSMQTGNVIAPSTFYSAETHNVSLPNGVNSKLTQFAYFPGSCKKFLSTALAQVKAWPKNLIITTDGSCGSACAAFVAKMTKLGSAKIVAVGGDTKNTNVTMRTASFPGGNVVAWTDMKYFTNATIPFTTSAIARFNWHQAFSSASFDEYPLEYNYDAFAPTHKIRWWGMVVNDDPVTDAGLSNLVLAYGSVAALWGDYVQKLPPTPPGTDAPYDYKAPINGPVSSPNGSDSHTTYVEAWIVIVVGLVAAAALILAIVFGIKYAQMKKLLGDEGRARLLPYVN